MLVERFEGSWLLGVVGWWTRVFHDKELNSEWSGYKQRHKERIDYKKANKKKIKSYSKGFEQVELS